MGGSVHESREGRRGGGKGEGCADKDLEGMGDAWPAFAGVDSNCVARHLPASSCCWFSDVEAWSTWG
jgi:hypothetical protein